MKKSKRRKPAAAAKRGGTRRAASAVATPAQPALEVPSEASGIRAAIELLRDSTRPVEARLRALQNIQAASFAVAEFDSVRPDYTAALRQAAQDNDHELRQRALGILAREHDGFAQEALLAGLRDPEKALVAADKALQLLNYDAHSGAYPIAREIAKSSPDASARREALRMLSGDPQSAGVLEEVLGNRNEPRELRRMSASALHALHPERLQRWANKAVLDDAEDTDIVATSLTALTQFGDAKAIAGNKPLRKRLDQLQRKAPAKIKQLAKRCVQKHQL